MNKKALLPGVFLPLMMGSAALTNTLRNPRMEGVHTVDILSIFAAGLCFGAAFVSLVRILRGKA